MAREFLTINGINIEPTEDNIVNAVKKALEDFNDDSFFGTDGGF